MIAEGTELTDRVGSIAAGVALLYILGVPGPSHGQVQRVWFLVKGG